MYHLDSSLNWLAAATLSGSWPYFTHAPLTTGAFAPNLYCGLLFSDGREMRQPCDPNGDGVSNLTLFPPRDSEPIGFYLLASQAQDSITVDNIAIRSWLP